jgi:hypothetical protein
MIDEPQASPPTDGLLPSEGAHLIAVIEHQRHALATALDDCADPGEQVRIQEVLLTLDVLAASGLQRIPERISRDLAEWVSHSAHMGAPELRRAATRLRRAAAAERKSAAVAAEAHAVLAAGVARVAARHDEIATTSEHLVPGGRF